MESEYICEICKKDLKFKSYYNKHINKKNKCSDNSAEKKENITDIIDLDKLHKMLDNINHKIKTRNNNSLDNICGYCFKEFSNKNNVKRHLINSCFEKKIFDDEKEKILGQLKVVRLVKKEEVVNNEKKEIHQNTIINNNTTNNNININNNVNVNNVNILVNNFGKEDISHLTKKDFINYINKMYDGLTKLIEDCHFSDKNKNNFNVYLTSMRNEFANIYQNDTWILKDVEDVIYQLKDDKLAILDQKAEEYNDDKLKNTIETFKQRLYSNTEAEKNLNKNIKLVMVNNSEKIIAQKKKSKRIKNKFI